MEKTVLVPELGEIESTDLDTTVSAVGVVTEREGYRKVALSGLIRPESDLETQTQTVLEDVTEILAYDPGGSMADVTRVRWYVREEALTPENRAVMHEAGPTSSTGRNIVAFARRCDALARIRGGHSLREPLLTMRE